MRDHSLPSIELINRQRTVPISIRRLQRFGDVASALVWKYKRPQSEIESLQLISVLILSDRRMAELHKDFCGIAGPTDVLTFHHGEIAISADTAARQARVFRNSLRSEIELYLLHGLLHLAGFDDNEPRDRKKMHQLQEKLLSALRHPSANTSARTIR